MLEELNLSSEQLEGVKSFVQAEKDNLIKDYEQQLNELKSKLPRELSDEEKAYNEKIKALEEKEKQLLQKEKDFEIQSVLNEKGLNVELYKFLNFNEVEDIKDYINLITPNTPFSSLYPQKKLKIFNIRFRFFLYLTNTFLNIKYF